MQAKTQTIYRSRIGAKQGSGFLPGCDEIERVMRQLDELMRGSSPARHPIEEQLKQCPDAFKVGELMERMFDTAHGTHEERGLDQIGLLPPAGAVIPPLV